MNTTNGTRNPNEVLCLRWIFKSSDLLKFSSLFSLGFTLTQDSRQCVYSIMAWFFCSMSSSSQYSKFNWWNRARPMNCSEVRRYFTINWLWWRHRIRSANAVVSIIVSRSGDPSICPVIKDFNYLNKFQLYSELTISVLDGVSGVSIGGPCSGIVTTVASRWLLLFWRPLPFECPDDGIAAVADNVWAAKPFWLKLVGRLGLALLDGLRKLKLKTVYFNVWFRGGLQHSRLWSYNFDFFRLDVADAIAEALAGSAGFVLLVGFVNGCAAAGQFLNWDVQYFFSCLAKRSRSLRFFSLTERNTIYEMTRFQEDWWDISLPRATDAELLHVFGLGFLRFGVGVSILEFLCWEKEMHASFGCTRLDERLIRSRPVNRWNVERSCPRMLARSGPGS